jgi:hypothetical protein
MQRALTAFTEGKTGLNEYFRGHGIPKRSFEMYLKISAKSGVCVAAPRNEARADILIYMKKLKNSSKIP